MVKKIFANFRKRSQRQIENFVNCFGKISRIFPISHATLSRILTAYFSHRITTHLCNNWHYRTTIITIDGYYAGGSHWRRNASSLGVYHWTYAKIALWFSYWHPDFGLCCLIKCFISSTDWQSIINFIFLLNFFMVNNF